MCMQGVRKLHQQLQAAREAKVDKEMPRQVAPALAPLAMSLKGDLDEGAKVRSALQFALQV